LIQLEAAKPNPKPFPCRLLWSRSQHATGELFLALKRNQEEPDAAAAALVGLPAGIAAAAAAGDGTAAAAAAGGGGGGDAGGISISSAMVTASAAAASMVAQHAQVSIGVALALQSTLTGTAAFLHSLFGHTAATLLLPMLQLAEHLASVVGRAAVDIFLSGGSYT
jgi:hypothetical protein